MRKRVSGLLTALISLSALTACGEAPATYPQQYGYQQNPYQYNQAYQQNPQQPYGQQYNQYQQPQYGQPYAQQPYGQQYAPQTQAYNQQQGYTQSLNPVSAGNTSAAAGKPAAAKPAASASKSTIDPNLPLANKIVMKAKQTYDNTNSYNATITIFSKRNDRTVPKSTPLVKARFKYTFQQPRNSAFMVEEHNISVAIGAKIVWKGADSVRVKAAGALGLVPMTLDLTDTKLTTNRNWNFGQLDHVAILSRALDPKAQLTLAGKSVVNGKDVYMIKVKGVGLDEEVTEENIAIDVKNFTVVANEMYSGTELVFQSKIDLEATNVAITTETFEI